MSIRVRLAGIFAVLVVALLTLAMGTVYLIEKRELHRRLAADARAAAAELAQRRHEGEDASRFLGRHAGSGTLYWLARPGKAARTNVPLARVLGRERDLAPGTTRTTTIQGEAYAVAAVRADGRVALAAVPRARVEDETTGLLDAMLLVGGIGLVAALAAAWFSVGRALSPLTRIARQASRITAGDLSHRVTSGRAPDEVARLAGAIDAMLERLERAFAAQRRLVHDVSHELRTPITIARGHLEVARLPGEPGPTGDAVDLALAELTRMGEMVERLLQLAAADEGEVLPAPELVSLADVAVQAVERSRLLASRRFALDVQGATVVLGDSVALEQLVLNLLTNAVRHTPPDSTIRVSVAEADDHVRLDVCDEGDGIPAEALPTLFDRFTRTDTARRRDGGGAGLGLAICQAIVSAHRGTIDVASTLGEGTCFTVLLPARTRIRPLDREVVGG